MKKIASTLKSFNTEFQPFIDEINIKEGAIAKYAGAATMQRIKGTYLPFYVWTIVQILTQTYRHQRGPSGFYVATKWLVVVPLFLNKECS